MVSRKSIVQVKFRMRQELFKRLTLAAKNSDRSINDEIARRVEASFELDNTRETNERLMVAIEAGLRRHPAAAASVKEMTDELEATNEKAAQQDFPTARLDDKPKPKKRSRK
jgi:Arc-like DNA binding domain